MIFKPELVKRVNEGRKSQTRRPVRPGEDECRYRPGKAYALQPGRGRKAVGRITVLEVRRESVGGISLRDAKREGFRTIDEFKAYWAELYGVFDDAVEVWVISFTRGDLADRPRFPSAGAPREAICQALVPLPNGGTRPCGRKFGREFPDEPERCNAGHSKPSEQDSDHGYTTQPSRGLKGAGEAIPVGLQERYAAAARQQHGSELSERRERLLAAVADLRLEAAKQNAGSATARRRLKTIEHNLRALSREWRHVA